MGRHIRRTWIAILLVCAWALFILCAPFDMPPAEVHAATVNDVLTVKVLDTVGDTTGDLNPFEWGTFYRGMMLLEQVHFQSDPVLDLGEAVANLYSVDPGDDVDGDDNVVTLNELYAGNRELDGTYGIIAYNGTMFKSGHAHDFISGAGEKAWEACDTDVDPDGMSHWAVCECGAKFQVAHRPRADGTCVDCGAALEGFNNAYSFTVPDSIGGEDDEVVWDENVATFEIPVTATLFLGYTLTLFLDCNGTFACINEGYEADLPYTIEVDFQLDNAYTADCGVGDSLSFSGDPVAIWWYTASEGDSTDEYGVMGVIAGTITVTITVPDDLDSETTGLLYSGDYTDTLYFSATLEGGD